MSETISAGEWQRVLGALCGLDIDEAAASAASGSVRRNLASVAGGTPGRLFDLEPAQFAVVLGGGVAS